MKTKLNFGVSARALVPEVEDALARVDKSMQDFGYDVKTDVNTPIFNIIVEGKTDISDTEMDSKIEEMLPILTEKFKMPIKYLGRENL